MSNEPQFGLQQSYSVLHDEDDYWRADDDDEKRMEAVDARGSEPGTVGTRAARPRFTQSCIKCTRVSVAR